MTTGFAASESASAMLFSTVLNWSSSKGRTVIPATGPWSARTVQHVDAVFVEQDLGARAGPGCHRYYASVSMPVLSPTYLYPRHDAVYVVCGLQRCAAVPDGVRAVVPVLLDWSDTLMGGSGWGSAVSQRSSDDDVLRQTRDRVLELTRNVIKVDWRSSVSMEDFAGCLPVRARVGW
jgi:hypothetical protein